MGWSNTEELLFVQEDGVVIVYDYFLNFKRTFGMGQVHLSHNARKPAMWFPNRSDTNQAVSIEDG